MAKQPTAIDWDRAFAFFAALDPTERSYPRVAQEFAVSLTSVKKHGKAGRWIERTEALDRQAAEQAERQVVKSRAERILDTIKVADETRQRYLAQLQRPDFEVKGSDVAALSKLEALLEGEATERIDVAEVQAALREMLDLALEFLPSSKHESFLGEFGRRFAHASNGSGS